MKPWLHTTGKTPDWRQVSTILWRVRNALIHALSLPRNVRLVPTPADYAGADVEYGITPDLFVRSVEETIKHIIAQQPQTVLDGRSNGMRAPVELYGASTASMA